MTLNKMWGIHRTTLSDERKKAHNKKAQGPKILEEEVRSILKDMKKKKAAKPDSITTEMTPELINPIPKNIGTWRSIIIPVH